MSYDSARRDYLLLNADVGTPPTAASADERGKLYVNRASGPPDGLFLGRLDSTGLAYEYARVVMANDAIPVAQINAGLLSDGLLLNTGGSVSSTVMPSISSIVIAGGIRAGGTNGTPSYAAGTSAGATATITATAGGDAHGELTLNVAGAGISTGQMVTVTFTTALANNNYDVIFMPRNANAALIGMYLAVRGTGSFTVSFATAPTAGQAYSFSYWVVGR